MLTSQLRELVEDQLITRYTGAGAQPQVCYALTALGQSLMPIIDPMCAWGEHRIQHLAVTPPYNIRLPAETPSQP